LESVAGRGVGGLRVYTSAFNGSHAVDRVVGPSSALT